MKYLMKILIINANSLTISSVNMVNLMTDNLMLL